MIQEKILLFRPFQMVFNIGKVRCTFFTNLVCHMDFKTKYITHDIKLSSYEDKLFKTEVLFEHHMLVWFISGETKIIQSGASYLFRAGEIFLIPRNQLATVILYPKDGLPHKSVVMHLSVDRLRDFYATLDVKPRPSITDKIYCFKNHRLLQSCLS